MPSFQRLFRHFYRLVPGHNVAFKPRWRRRSVLTTLAMAALLCTTQLPALAKQPASPFPLRPITRPHLSQASDPAVLFQQSQMLYQTEDYDAAIALLKQAVQGYQQQGQRLEQAIALGNLSLAYQKQGQWSPAAQSINQSLNLLSETGASRRTQAALLDIQASLQLDTGKADSALATWQQSEQYYQDLADNDALVRNRISQAQALRILGFYRRALDILETAPALLEGEPDSVEKATRLRLLGDALRLSGRSEDARLQLQKSLDIAEAIDDRGAISAAYFSLGNTARAADQFGIALEHYRQARRFAPSTAEELQVSANQFSLLMAKQQWSQARALWQELRPQLSQLPANRTGTYTLIHVVQNALEADPQDLGIPSVEFVPILQRAIAQAQILEDSRAQAHGLGTLGRLYEINRRWEDALQTTQLALQQAQTLEASDISYQLNWQMGRLLTQQDRVEPAIAAYDSAIADLQNLRRDLVAVNRDIQFSFKESVEPVYRESVGLLVKSEDKAGKSLQNLEKARARIEALQVAELDNFFREACLDGQAVLLDKVVDEQNPTTAIVYPIILEDRLEVIVKAPGEQQLQHRGIDISREDVQAVLNNLRRNLPDTTLTTEIQQDAQTVYKWLIEPFEEQLADADVDTLVFVLDGSFRSIPMGVLYDGEQYLIQKYALGLSLGLQLQAPKAIAQTNLNVLAAGLIDPPAGYQQFPPLPAIEQEFQLIDRTGVTNEQILNQAFTSEQLSRRVNGANFNVVHLATHGLFSSNADETYILAADGPIKVAELDGLLRARSQSDADAIELLILSACQTAEGDERAALGLAGVAVKAGARSTLASLWQVDDESTARVMGYFYQQLSESKATKAKALRQAQLALLENPELNYPALWAPFVMVGNWL